MEEQDITNAGNEAIDNMEYAEDEAEMTIAHAPSLLPQDRQVSVEPFQDLTGAIAAAFLSNCCQYGFLERKVMIRKHSTKSIF